MGTSRWKPLPDDVMGAARELAVQLRRLVDDEGLTLRQLAADDNVPHNVTMLRRFFSGRVLPPRQLVEVIADRCGGNREQLLSTLDRAVVATDAGLPWAAEAAPRPRRSLRDRPAFVIGILAGLFVGTNALTAAVIVRLSDRPASASAGAGSRSAPPIRQPSSKPTSSRAHTPTATPAPSSIKRPSRGYRAAPQDTSGNMIRNGTFTGTVESWWPVSDVRIKADANRLRSDVAGGSTQPWDRIVSPAGFPLQSGRTYTLTFDAAADADISDRVTVELDYPPYTEAISRRIDLTTSMLRFSYRFTTRLTTEQAALNFELGGHTGDHTIWLDNVTLVPS
jgi:hypothetical protein